MIHIRPFYVEDHGVIRPVDLTNPSELRAVQDFIRRKKNEPRRQKAADGGVRSARVKPKGYRSRDGMYGAASNASSWTQEEVQDSRHASQGGIK